ncbi:11S globulin seed storage protein G3-like protein [Tanacetum coccineum]|uniref:11S globulin seed storage protein G3-like protein n=1 Tax=Tanacetum coccineum TaxID=301880 RepID=A0ABQ5GIS2_9ASTR
MASKASLLILFSFLLVSTSFARQQQHQQQQQNLCQLRNIEALEPYDVVQAEAGVTEFWDANDQQFQCAGVDFIRHRIQPGGLMLPSYVNTPLLSLIERGSAVHGVILPGCPETYESSQVQQQQFTGQGQRRGQGEHGGQQSVQTDRHQKVENLNKGDVVAIPAGAAHWIYNDGQEELVAVVFFDAQNKDNQLDEVKRRFFLAGNLGAQSQQQGRQSQPWRQQGQGQGRQDQPWRQQGQGQGRQDQPRRQQEQGQGRRQSQPHRDTGNIFNGFDVEFIAEAFNVDTQTAEKLQGQNDQRGHIVNVGQNLQIIRPQQSQQQHQKGQPQRQSKRGGGYGSNGLEETICSMKLKENIENPSHADFVNPQAGQISNLNSFKFPILQQLQLSVERGELNQNAIQTPHWTINAHKLVYVTDGSMRIQIVNNEGNSVFDDELREGQVVVIPQNYAVIKRAGQQGCRWVAFKTNDNAMISNLAGRVSAIRSMPVDVVANSYQLSIEDAQRLKFSQQQTVLLTPSSSSQGRRSQGGLRADA